MIVLYYIMNSQLVIVRPGVSGHSLRVVAIRLGEQSEIIPNILMETDWNVRAWPPTKSPASYLQPENTSSSCIDSFSLRLEAKNRRPLQQLQQENVTSEFSL